MLKFQYQTYGLEYHSILAKMKSLVFMIIKHFFSLKPYTMYPGISKKYSMSNNHGTPLSLRVNYWPSPQMPSYASVATIKAIFSC